MVSLVSSILLRKLRVKAQDSFSDKVLASLTIHPLRRVNCPAFTTNYQPVKEWHPLYASLLLLENHLYSAGMTSKVSKVEVNKPPITTVANGF
jgi:hypothetical protein